MVRDLEPEVVISFQNGHVVSQEKRVHSPQLLEPLLEHDLVNPLFFFGEKVFQRVGALTEKRPPGLDHTVGEQGVSFNAFQPVYQGFELVCAQPRFYVGPKRVVRQLHHQVQEFTLFRGDAGTDPEVPGIGSQPGRIGAGGCNRLNGEMVIGFCRRFG